MRELRIKPPKSTINQNPDEINKNFFVVAKTNLQSPDKKRSKEKIPKLTSKTH